MEISNINPYIRVALQGTMKHGQSIRQRVIYDYEVICLEKGNFTLVYADKAWKCAEGDIIFICPGIPHSFHIDSGDISQPHIHFDMTYRPGSEKIPVSFKDITEMNEKEKNWIHENYFKAFPSEPLLNIKDMRNFIELFWGIFDCSVIDDRVSAKGKLTELISVIIRDNFPNVFEKQTAYSVSNHIKDYIDAGNGFGLDLDDFARLFSYSKYYIERRFKENFEIGIIKYRNNKRMQHANILLETMSVSKVAEELGYNSIYSFSRAYKNHYGNSPSKAIKKSQP